MGFFTALTLIFIVLKATGLIALSWWWVLAPAAVWTTIYIVVSILVVKYPLFFIGLWRNK
jgi:hypothetical protein